MAVVRNRKIQLVSVNKNNCLPIQSCTVSERALLIRTGKQTGFQTPTRSFPVSGEWLAKFYNNNNSNNNNNNNNNISVQSQYNVHITSRRFNLECRGRIPLYIIHVILTYCDFVWLFARSFSHFYVVPYLCTCFPAYQTIVYTECAFSTTLFPNNSAVTETFNIQT